MGHSNLTFRRRPLVKAVAIPMALTTQRSVLADLLTLPDDGLRYELLGGELVEVPPPDVAHALVVVALILYFGDAQRAGYGLVATAPCAAALDYVERGLRAIDGPQPDVQFVRQEQAHIMRGDVVQGVPDLVVEVLSPRTEKNDRPGGDKWRAYERNGVPFYWLVDTDERTVTQYVYQDGRYGEGLVLRAGDLLRCPLFPAITRDVAALFANIRG